MRCIQNNNLNPYFNLASEEYLLKKTEDECFMLWRNNPSVIVGKHQNTYAEINVEFIKAHNIPVVRRLSGGGTVFHDPGNLNFTFITNGSGNDLVNFKKYTQPLIEVLAKLGVEAKFEGKNDLRVNGKKISGNAEHVYKKRVLHHGTLLFSSELGSLKNALKIVPGKYIDNAVKSIRSDVANIIDFLENKMDVMEFQQHIFNHIKTNFKNAFFSDLTNDEQSEINKIAESKYATWEWNYGYSPQYSLSNKINTLSCSISVSIEVREGIIADIKFKNIGGSKQKLSEIEKIIKGSKHNYHSIIKKLENVKLSNYISGIDLPTFVGSLF